MKIDLYKNYGKVVENNSGIDSGMKNSFKQRETCCNENLEITKNW